MKPYSDRGNLSPDEVRFNFALSKSPVVVENATLEHAVNIVTTCSIPHNFSIITNQRFLHEWLL